MTNRFTRAPRANDVVLSHDALFDRCVEEIFVDVLRVRCEFEEATERVAEAILVHTSISFAPRELKEVTALLRARGKSDPELRKAFGCASVTTRGRARRLRPYRRDARH